MSWIEVGWLVVTLGAIYLIGTLSVGIINEAVRSDEYPSGTPKATIIVPLPVSVTQRR